MGFRGVVDNLLDCDIVVSEFEPQLQYSVHFQTNRFRKGMSHLSPTNGLNSTITVLLQRWLWHYITHERRYAIKQRDKTHINVTIYLSANKFTSVWFIFLSIGDPVGWSWRIYRLLLCRGVRPPHTHTHTTNDFPGIKLSESVWYAVKINYLSYFQTVITYVYPCM